MRFWISFAVLGLASALAGCDYNAPLGSSPTPVASASEIQLPQGDAKALQAIIDQHKGEVVFVDFWATWCGPCVEGFPHTVELSKKYKGQGLATIAVSFDSLENEGAVREFLKKQGADFDHLLSKYDGVSQDAAVDFDVEALPQYRLYDRQGKLRHKWEGKSEEIEPAIQTLLAEK